MIELKVEHSTRRERRQHAPAPLEAKPRPAAASVPQPGKTSNVARPDGITLDRLLAVATLTRAQATLLIHDVIDQLESTGTSGRYPARLRGRAITASGAGTLTIGAPAASPASWHDVNEAAGRLLRRIATNTRRHAFIEQVTESTSRTVDLNELTRRVRRALTSVDATEELTRRQLGELVTVIRGRPLQTPAPMAPPAPAAPPAQATDSPSLAPSGWFPPVRSPWHHRRRRPTKKRVVIGAVAVLALVGVAWVAPAAWSDLRQGWDAVLNPVTPSEQNQIAPVSPPPPAPAAEPADPTVADGVTAPAPVEVDAPTSAGPINGVTATFANGICAPGQPCDMRVDVQLDPTADVAAVSWTLNVYDRCSGEIHASSEVTVPTQLGRQEVYGVTRATLPAGTALGIAAVTTTPAVAASEPALIPAENARC